MVFMSLSVLAQEETYKVYYDSFYNSQGEFDYFLSSHGGAAEEDATYKTVYYRVNVKDSDGTIHSFHHASTYYKKEDGEWKYIGSWWYIWSVIVEFIESILGTE